MLYAFGDESYPYGSGGRSATYLVIAVRQDDYRSRMGDLRSSFKANAKRRQKELLETLRRLEASVVLGKAEIPKHLDSVKAIEAPDIGKISVRAALWSWVFGFTCSVTLHNVIKSGIVFSCADFYYENNDLSSLHEELTHDAMRRLLRDQLTEPSALRFGPHAPQPTLRGMTPVPKWPKPFSPQHIQLGVSCAHEIQTFALHSPNEAEDLSIEVRDFSKVVAEMCATGQLVAANERD